MKYQRKSFFLLSKSTWWLRLMLFQWIIWIGSAYCLLIMVACRNGKTPTSPPVLLTEATANQSTHMQSQPTPAPPPNTCLVTAQVIRIHDPNTSVKDSSPCGRFACKAQIRIVTVHAYGSAFSGAVNTGDSAEAYFAFTLQPTQNLFPQREQPLPGLRVNDTFTALLHKAGLPGGTAPAYTVYDYQKQ